MLFIISLCAAQEGHFSDEVTLCPTPLFFKNRVWTANFFGEFHLSPA